MIRSIANKGERFSRWTALSCGKGHEKIACRCDCGVVSAVSVKSLCRGQSRECRKCSFATSAAKCRRNIIGEKFGLLTVVSRSGKQCECRCQCGATVIRTFGALTRGNTTSCGHDRGKAKSAAAFDKYQQFIGERFGAIVVTDQVAGKFVCRCDCGKEFSSSRVDVVNGRVMSCGHDRFKNMATATAERSRKLDVFGVKMSCADIARLLDCSTTAIYLRVKRAGADMRQVLAPFRMDGPRARLLRSRGES